MARTRAITALRSSRALRSACCSCQSRAPRRCRQPTPSRRAVAAASPCRHRSSPPQPRSGCTRGGEVVHRLLRRLHAEHRRLRLLLEEVGGAAAHCRRRASARARRAAPSAPRRRRGASADPRVVVSRVAHGAVAVERCVQRRLLGRHRPDQAPGEILVLRVLRDGHAPELDLGRRDRIFAASSRQTGMVVVLILPGNCDFAAVVVDVGAAHRVEPSPRALSASRCSRPRSGSPRSCAGRRRRLNRSRSTVIALHHRLLVGDDLHVGRDELAVPRPREVDHVGIGDARQHEPDDRACRRRACSVHFFADLERTPRSSSAAP